MSVFFLHHLCSVQHFRRSSRMRIALTSNFVRGHGKRKWFGRGAFPWSEPDLNARLSGCSANFQLLFAQAYGTSNAVTDLSVGTCTTPSQFCGAAYGSTSRQPQTALGSSCASTIKILLSQRLFIMRNWSFVSISKSKKVQLSRAFLGSRHRIRNCYRNSRLDHWSLLPHFTSRNLLPTYQELGFFLYLHFVIIFRLRPKKRCQHFLWLRIHVGLKPPPLYAYIHPTRLCHDGVRRHNTLLRYDIAQLLFTPSFRNLGHPNPKDFFRTAGCVPHGSSRRLLFSVLLHKHFVAVFSKLPQVSH